MEEAEAHKGAGQVQEGQHRGGLAVVPDGEAAKSEQPGDGPLHDPPIPTEALTRVHAPAGDPRGDAPAAQGPPEDREVVARVRVELGRPAAGATRLPDGAPDG